MNPSKGYFSLIQYCPDAGRLEAANVGVLLFCPEHMFLESRISRNNRRIIQFFGRDGHDWQRINSFKQGLEERLVRESSAMRTLDDLNRFIALQANELTITQPRPMKVFDPKRDLDRLCTDFLGEKPTTAERRTLRAYVKGRLQSAGLERKLRTDIHVKIPILQNKPMEVPFGYQNGRFNLLTPVAFAASSAEHIELTASKYAVRGQSLYDHEDAQLGPLQFCVIGKFRHNDRESPSLVETVLNEHQVKLYRVSELPRLIDEIRRTGKEFPDSTAT